ncbi:hypothetical protein PspTeo4_44080 [Pseudomonas sp. Teo4]|nr:hypothetical protein [Pseudomonas sp. Teo4]
MHNANVTSTKAMNGLVTVFSAISSGTVNTVPRAPNSSIELRRPIRSESMPKNGCSTMNRNSAPVMTKLALLAFIPAVLTRYFCM